MDIYQWSIINDMRILTILCSQWMIWYIVTGPEDDDNEREAGNTSACLHLCNLSLPLVFIWWQWPTPTTSIHTAMWHSLALSRNWHQHSTLYTHKKPITVYFKEFFMMMPNFISMRQKLPEYHVCLTDGLRRIHGHTPPLIISHSNPRSSTARWTRSQCQNPTPRPNFNKAFEAFYLNI